MTCPETPTLYLAGVSLGWVCGSVLLGRGRGRGRGRGVRGQGRKEGGQGVRVGYLHE